MRARRWSIATRVLTAQLAAFVALGGVLTLVLWADARTEAERDAARVSLAVSHAIAVDPFVSDAISSDDPTAALEPYSLAIAASDGLDFITIMDTNGIRWTHPDRSQIGGRFLGTTSAALQGRSITETFTGTLGPSVRAVVPVMHNDSVVAIVSAGVTITNVGARVAQRLPIVLGLSLGIIAVGSIIALAIARSLRRVTGALSPRDLERMTDFYSAVLHGAHEGLVLVDADRRIVLYNDEAADLLGLPPAQQGREPLEIDALQLPGAIAALLTSGVRAVEESHLVHGRVLVVNQESARPVGSARSHVVGTVLTVRDRTEVRRLTGELESVRTLTAALRSHTHENANRLHTIVSLIELGRTDEAIAFAAESTRQSQTLTDDLMSSVDEPALAALLLGKSAEAHDRGIGFHVDADGSPALPAGELVSIVGNLVDNALDAAPGGSVGVLLHRFGVTVTDTGRGVDEGSSARVFEQGYSTKPSTNTGRGFGLAIVREIAERHGGDVVLDQSPGHTRFTVRLP